MSDVILYHANCLDGKASAAIALKAIPTAILFPVEYQRPLPKLPDNTRRIYILDFSYPREVILGLQEYFEITILDHHRTAQEQLLGVKGALFDMTKSGAMLTWEYFFPEEEPPRAVRLIQDRDLWQWKLEETGKFTKAVWELLMSAPYTEWINLLENNQVVDDLIAKGALIEVVHQNQVTKQVRAAYWGNLPGREELVPIVNTSNLVSETCEALYTMNADAPYVAAWFQVGEVLRYSLRSSKNGADVSAIAKEYGGGGHYHAAGFDLAIEPLISKSTH